MVRKAAPTRCSRLTGQGVERAERIARDQGLASQQKAWSGLVKPGELQHDVAVYSGPRGSSR